jgi:hypothetical protein
MPDPTVKKLNARRRSFFSGLDLALALILTAFLASSCVVKPKNYLPRDISLGQFTGQGAQEVKNQLSSLTSTKANSSQKLVLSAKTNFSLTSQYGLEKVGLSDHESSHWPEGLPGWENAVQKEPDYEISQYPLTLVKADMQSEWTLTEAQSQIIVSSGTSKVTLQRSYDGYLASQGKAQATPPVQQDLLNDLAKALAAQIIQSIGPAFSAENLASAKDSRSRQAASMVAADDWTGAAAIWIEILRENPEYAPALFNLGLYHERQGNLDTAWSLYRQAFLNSKTWPFRLALTRTTEALERQGRLPKASSTNPF